ncbi:sugar ABC transporter ATP-binding protein [Rathayibacter sp. VKM Ac-2835]|uniref:ATP-binding cassette domain-containing protein n=1 Tax=Rathayibacter sp. VKM Ac-2835 TaxID=2739043 RepID=UPI00156607B6|nr:ATP-binding cassette domain-containing protein [Rathayibacter sp. VKM Ac-2835]NRG43053.1 sugar ABC transporter ATP-binding protein [Rathayibacter sp. VKM Ac-2835]
MTSTASAATTASGSSGTTPILELRGVSKRFGAVQALSDINLTVAPGEVVALVGDNGAGKSTLVKIIAGVYQHDTGDILIDGAPVNFDGPGAAQAAGVATVFQDLALCDNLDVVANLFLGKETKRGRMLDEASMEQQSWNLLKQLSARIPSVHIPIASLSGGQRQTVAIARSLLGDPKLILLDEPTAALGVAQTAEVLNLVERIRDRGLGVILISHNMADVQAVADRVLVLRLGKNNGIFEATASTETLVSAITGASDNVVTARNRRIAETAGIHTIAREANDA